MKHVLGTILILACSLLGAGELKHVQERTPEFGGGGGYTPQIAASSMLHFFCEEDVEHVFVCIQNAPPHTTFWYGHTSNQTPNCIFPPGDDAHDPECQTPGAGEGGIWGLNDDGDGNIELLWPNEGDLNLHAHTHGNYWNSLSIYETYTAKMHGVSPNGGPGIEVYRFNCNIPVTSETGPDPCQGLAEFDPHVHATYSFNSPNNAGVNNTVLEIAGSWQLSSPRCQDGELQTLQPKKFCGVRYGPAPQPACLVEEIINGECEPFRWNPQSQQYDIPHHRCIDMAFSPLDWCEERLTDLVGK